MKWVLLHFNAPLICRYTSSGTPSKEGAGEISTAVVALALAEGLAEKPSSEGVSWRIGVSDRNLLFITYCLNGADRKSIVGIEK